MAREDHVDAQGNLEELSNPSAPNLAACSTGAHLECEPTTCRFRCAMEVIDDLLAEPGAVSGDEMDQLLDLRWHLRHRTDADASLRLFCEVRRRMEHRHYLAFFRIRRWMENHLLAEVRLCPAAEPRLVSVKLDHYCVEALRRVCLCSALGHGTVILAPRLRFAFRPQVAPVLEAANVAVAAAH
jgi:hypothetical protein